MTDIAPVYTNIKLKPYHPAPPERNSQNPASAVAGSMYGENNTIYPEKKEKIGFGSKMFNWGKGFVNGVYSYTVGLLLNPIKLGLVLAAGVGGALFMTKKGVSLNKAVKTELVIVGSASAIKGIFDIRGYMKNKEAGKIEKAKKNIEELGKSSAHMCLPLAIPLVPAVTKFARTTGWQFIKNTALKLF